jgi:hypothetical protein
MKSKTEIFSMIFPYIAFVLQLAASFAPRFHNSIFRCKRISETGAQQVKMCWIHVVDSCQF